MTIRPIAAGAALPARTPCDRTAPAQVPRRATDRRTHRVRWAAGGGPPREEGGGSLFLGLAALLLLGLLHLRVLLARENAAPERLQQRRGEVASGPLGLALGLACIGDGLLRGDGRALLLDLLEMIGQLIELLLLLLIGIHSLAAGESHLLDRGVVRLDDAFHVHLVTLGLRLLAQLLLLIVGPRLLVRLLQGVDLAEKILLFGGECRLVVLHPLLVLVAQLGHALRFRVAHVEELGLELRQDLVAVRLCSLACTLQVRKVLLQLLPPLAGLGLAVLVVLQELCAAPLLLYGRREALERELLHVREGLEELDDVARGIALLEVSELRHDVRDGPHLPAQLQGVFLQGVLFPSDLLALVAVGEVPVRGRARHDVELLEAHLLRELLH
mmetsp:Transcript_43337/g.116299  ORF Transcript_43337/g.116299 Transcript_43337/m.116299 type:complete len:386 (+) Transcript_43337:2-1159(+)